MGVAVIISQAAVIALRYVRNVLILKAVCNI